MSLDVQIWALAHGSYPDLALPDLADYSITPQASGVGAVSFDYPRDGRNFATLRAMVDERRNVEVEIRTDGTAATALRALLFTAEGDDIAESAVWTFTGKTLFTLLEDWCLPYNDDWEAGGDPDNGETFIEGTPGTVVGTLLARAKTDGCCLDLTSSTWSTTHDSNGQAWANEITVSLSPGRSLADVISTTLAKIVDAEVTSGRAVKLYNPGAMGTDRTLPGPGQVTLEHGRDLADAPVRFDLTDARSALVVSGSDGIYTTASDAAATARLGRKRVGYQSFNSVEDPGSLDAVALLALDGVSSGAAEYSQGLTLEGLSRVVPGRDFGLGDWVLRAVNGATQRLQVQRYTLSRKGQEITAAVTMGDLIQARAVRTQARIDAILGGDVATGTSVRPARADDGKLPAAPTGLVVTSNAYYDAAGTPLAQATATWASVTTNADGTLADDIVSYLVEYRYEPGQDLPTNWQPAGSSGVGVLNWSGLVADRIVNVRVSAQDQFGHVSAPSAVYVVQTARGSVAPPVLPAPIGDAYLGLLTWEWNGKGAAGEAMPLAFAHAELHMGPPGFTVHRPTRADGRTLDTAASTTYRDRLVGAGTLPVDPGGDYNVEWGARWVSVDTSGNASAPSAEGRATRQPVADGDIAEVSIGKLRAGILTAIMTIAGIIRTATTGARVELDSAGFRCIGAGGRVLFEFSIPTSVLTMVGRLVSGAGIGLGRTIVVDPDAVELNFYPDATTKRTRIRTFTGVGPGGTTGPVFEIAPLGATGTPNGSSLQIADGIIMKSDDDVGGRLDLSNSDATLKFDRASGVDASVQCKADGTVSIAGQLSTDKPLGSPVNGLSFWCQDGGTYPSQGVRMYAASGTLRFVDNASNTFVSDGASGLKSFVIDHPTDPDRWLVHGCIEGPEAAVLYRGVVDVAAHAAPVELPAYFAAATRPGSATVQLTQELRPGDELVAHAATPVEGGRFVIRTAGPCRVAWQVTAARADVDELVVEPRRDQVDVHGDGPYRYLVPREAA